MNTRLHKLARTTPAVRAEMALSADSVAVLACRHGVSEATARRRPLEGRVKGNEKPGKSSLSKIDISTSISFLFYIHRRFYGLRVKLALTKQGLNCCVFNAKKDC